MATSFRTRLPLGPLPQLSLATLLLLGLGQPPWLLAREAARRAEDPAPEARDFAPEAQGFAPKAQGFAAQAPDSAPPALNQETLRLEVTPPDYHLEFFPRVFAPGQRPLVLALGGGAAKGIAHAGVFQRLQEEGLPVSGIAGTSMGAFMGAMYAGGYSGFALQTLLEKVDVGAILLDRQHRYPGETLWEQENERITFLSAQYKPGYGLGFSPGTSPGLDLKRAIQILLGRSAHGPARSLDQLRVPFRAVATNLQTGRASAPDHGELPNLVRASMSIPGLFTPVLLGGHQHVDGMLVQNLPVETSRALVPGGAVVAVEVGGTLEAVSQTSILGLAFRALDVSIEERTEISRRAADLLLRPPTDRISHLEFHRWVGAAVASGRQTFDPALDALEGLIYGPGGLQPAPGGPLRVQAPEPLLGPLRALAEAALPQGPRQRRHYLRLLRRIHAQGLAQRAEVRFGPGGPVLEVEAQPTLRELDLRIPPEWAGVMNPLLDKARLRPGAPFNPVALGEVLDTFCLLTTLQGHPMIQAEGTAFDPARGRLRLEIQEASPTSIQVTPGILSPAQTTYIKNLLAPFEGHSLDARLFAQRLLLAEKRAGLEELRLSTQAGTGDGTLVVTPIPDNRTTVDGILAYESSWGSRFAVATRTNRAFGSDFGINLRASTDQLRDTLEVDITRVLGAWPRIGWRLFGTTDERQPPPAGHQPPFAAYPALWTQSRISFREQTAGLGLFARIGMDDRGLLALEYSRRWSTLHPALEGVPLPRLDQFQVACEWDSFDRYLFPTEGALLRLRVGQGWQDTHDLPRVTDPYQFAYARVRRLWPLGAWGSLDGDLETGLGWKLPMARWYTMGGPAFLAGTLSGCMTTPNFALTRLGLPLHAVTVFGVNLQVVPRIDAGYLGAPRPSQWRESTFVKGASLSLRSEIGRWYAEVSLGRWFSTDATGAEKNRINILLGAHPNDLWKDW